MQRQGVLTSEAGKAAAAVKAVHGFGMWRRNCPHLDLLKLAAASPAGARRPGGETASGQGNGRPTGG